MSRVAAVLAAALACAAGQSLAQEGTTLSQPPAACPGVIERAEYTDPTDRYDHGILGDAIEWGGLEIGYRASLPCSTGSAAAQIRLPLDMVFEDDVPLLVDVTGDGAPEVLTVETRLDLGARLTVWGVGPDGVIARLGSTAFIGQTHRWLAPVGAADFDGDGRIEIAFIDRPHLAKVLRLVRLDDGQLVEAALASGITNHRIGEPSVSGGIRDCNGRPEMILASGDWARLLALGFDGVTLVARDLGVWSQAGAADALACR